MATVCLYLQLHQPFRLRRYSVFDAGSDYFDDQRNQHLIERVARKCYRPTSKLLLELVKKHDGAFRVAFSLTGCVIDQLAAHAPDVLDTFHALAETGHVEFLGETSHHSLSFLYSRDEFREQVALHDAKMRETLGATPRVFRNTELIYSNDLARCVAAMTRQELGRPTGDEDGDASDAPYAGVLTEGAEHVLRKRLPGVLYRAPGVDGVKLLLKNFKLSDDIAFRFSNQEWRHWPLEAKTFAQWVSDLDVELTQEMARQVAMKEGAAAASSLDLAPQRALCNLFMDIETFGEHQWEETGIFTFLEKLPEALLNAGNTFAMPSECVETMPAADEYDVPHAISWADTERDLSAWLGNAMQSNAIQELYKLEQPIKATGDPQLLEDWRRLGSSDHFYYMCTKYFADGDVHKYFNPYESPYDSYINFMNVLDSLRTRAK